MPKLPIEHSDDYFRGRLPHIQRAIAEVRALHGIHCRCGRGASHLIHASERGVALCAGCAACYVKASALERRGYLRGQ